MDTVDKSSAFDTILRELHIVFLSTLMGMASQGMVVLHRLRNKGCLSLHCFHCTKSGGSTLVAPSAALVPSSASRGNTHQC